MAKVLFVTENYIKTFTPVGDLVQWTEIEPSVHLAQDSFIQDVLGTNFYNHIQDAFENQTLNTDETELVARIKPALAYRVIEQAITFIHYQIKNKGIQSQSGDYNQPVTIDEFKYMRNELKNRAEFFTKRFSTYLYDNKKLFPQYENNNDEDMKPYKGGYNNGGLAGIAFY
jgi:hypothetical protein